MPFEIIELQEYKNDPDYLGYAYGMVYFPGNDCSHEFLYRINDPTCGDPHVLCQLYDCAVCGEASKYFDAIEKEIKSRIERGEFV